MENLNSDTRIEKIDPGKLEKTDSTRIGTSIPKPMPAPGMELPETNEPPLSEDTIAIKKPIMPSKQPPPVSLEENPKKEEERQKEEKTAEPVSDKKPEEDAKTERRLKIFCYRCSQKLDLTEMEPFSKVECPSCASDILVPKWWDNYLLEELCGVGGMAKVYRGLDLALDREVAIKILNREIADDVDRNKLFLHEARTAATLNHYAILPIYTCGEFEGQAYFVMQYMPGGSLDQEFEKDRDAPPLAIPEAVRWLKDSCEALDNARRHGIIHHDIKPGNLMLDSDRNVKIGDFGISQAIYDSRDAEISELTKHWGSPEYVSPEKAQTGKETYLGDIYSLGATFYHLLTGEPPFDSHDHEVLLKAKTVKDPIDIRKLRDSIPESLAKLIMSMMDRTPEARPSYRDIIVELNAIKKPEARKKKSAAAPRKKAPAPTKTPVNISKPNLNDFDPAKYGIKKKSPAGLAVKVILLGLIAGAGYYVYTNGVENTKAQVMSLINPTADHYPAVTKLIRSGNTVQAAALAENNFKSLTSAGDNASEAALQFAICTYFNNEQESDVKSSFIAERLLSLGASPESPEISILKYLSIPSLSPDKLRAQLLSAPDDMKLAAEIAVFAKTLYNNGSDNEKKYALKQYAATASSPNIKNDFWGLAWGDRIQKWYDFIFAGTGNKNSLEPIFRRTVDGIVLMKEPGTASPAAKTTGDISTITGEWLKTRRPFADKRPKPADFTFTDGILKSYIAAIPAKDAAPETKRADIMKKAKHMLCRRMLAEPFRGTIETKDGKSYTGLVMANAKSIMIRPKGSKPVKLSWGDISPEQLAGIITYYAAKHAEKRPQEAAEAYLDAAVLADWYGDFDKAASLARKAAETDSGITGRIFSTLN